MGARVKGNADYEKGYRKGYQSGFATGSRKLKRMPPKHMIRDYSNFVEVVRCENCTWNERNIDGVNDHWCTYFGKDIEDNAYCSYGEAVE